MEGFGAVTFLHGAIQLGMGLDEFGRHGERVVKVGQRAGFILAGGASVPASRAWFGGWRCFGSRGRSPHRSQIFGAGGEDGLGLGNRLSSGGRGGFAKDVGGPLTNKIQAGHQFSAGLVSFHETG